MATIVITDVRVAATAGSLLTASVGDSVGITDARSTAASGSATIRITDFQVAADASTILTATVGDSVAITDATAAAKGGIATIRITEIGVAADQLPAQTLTVNIGESISMMDSMFDQYSETIESIGDSVALVDAVGWQKYLSYPRLYWTGTEWVGMTRRAWTGSAWKTL
jgi:hypothetical protein